MGDASVCTAAKGYRIGENPYDIIEKAVVGVVIGVVTVNLELSLG